MCIAQKHFNKFNKRGKTGPWEENPVDNLLYHSQYSAISTVSRFNVQELLQLRQTRDLQFLSEQHRIFSLMM